MPGFVMATTNLSDICEELALKVIQHEHWKQYYDSGVLPAPPKVHLATALYILVMSIIGAFGNVLLCWAFASSKGIRSASNLLIVNLAIADFGLSVASFPLLVLSSFSRKWLFGIAGCTYYGVTAGLFGMLSVGTMTAIAIDRACAITKWNKGPMTYGRALRTIMLIWLFAFAMSSPPLFGWSHYILEGLQTSCTFDFLTPSNADVSFVLYLFGVGFCVPLSVIIVCYTIIIRHLSRHRKMMLQADVNRGLVMKPKRSVNSIAESVRKNSDVLNVRATVTCLLVMSCFCLAWLPYAMVAMIGIFGDHSVLTPYVTSIPSLFAKSSAIYNPIIYALMNRKFRGAVRGIVCKPELNSQPHFEINYESPSSAAAHDSSDTL